MLSSMEPVIIKLPDAPIKIYPISDVHLGSPQFMKKEFASFVEKIKSEENSYVILNGDLINNALKSSVSNVYEETMRPCEQKRELAELLRPIKDKILCGTLGNHEARSSKDADNDPLYDVFSKLDIENRYRADACFLIIKINANNNKCNSEQRPVYTFCVTHGAGGGGMYIGSSANKAERFGMAIEGIDLLITGHTHKPLTFPVAKLRVNSQSGKITKQQFKVVTATSWLKYGGYPIRKMMTPAAYELAEIELSNRGKNIRVIM